MNIESLSPSGIMHHNHLALQIKYGHARKDTYADQQLIVSYNCISNLLYTGKKPHLTH